VSASFSSAEWQFILSPFSFAFELARYSDVGIARNFQRKATLTIP
jgi:hypothetical protein